MGLRERDEIRQPGHGPIVFQNFTNHRCRFKPGQLGEITSGLGMTRTREHAPGLRLQGKDVPRLHQILGACLGCNRRGDRSRPVGCADAGGHPLGRLNGYRKRRAM